ncbi:hypothetical protein ASPWEDRAFT_40682 [Aspergillus wentii DTO 134E9]|uniref:F-box domain-containing protein n=1 Tax=Aspergillus wentii DTO 134E9 TaxID=1073089 RepID=A0A1L9RKM5_ASPWE|nr:uncharacterized protein ASPWEDRAFT_40682 [Aspergillus wentii DTO 134E9]KAI9924753.1 hypothetical protein MW887_006609 [Aspergillus wentii]OJJ35480.1 hypothetical protein ASPWEDRAFT_40682 [Aspergillus wentii DTO 134E9]
MTSELSDALEKVTLQDQREEEGQIQQTEEEQNQPKAKAPLEPFRFFDLPSEIRLRVYSFVLFTNNRNKTLRTNGNVGASSKNQLVAPLSHRISLFLASSRLHDEASDVFYSTQIIRLFPVQDYSRVPTVRVLPARYRPSITTIELILGSSWTAPPKSWTVDNSLGLEDMVRARTLKVFTQCDPSQPFFEGFRISKEYYTHFSGDLLQQVLIRMPNLVQVEFDGFPSVRKSGPLMSRLLDEARKANKKILWGPERGWSDLDDDEERAYNFEGFRLVHERKQKNASHRMITPLNT